MIQNTPLRCLVVILVLLLPVDSFCASPSVLDASGMQDGDASAQDDKTGVAEVVARLQAHYDETDGFRADFTQEVTSATLGQTLNSRGRVFFKKPGRMRWEFEEHKQTLVCDGSFLWLYQPDEQQVVKNPFFNTRSVRRRRWSFLTGVGRLEEDFFVALQGETEDCLPTAFGRRKKAAEAVGPFWISRSASRRSTSFKPGWTDPLGNTTRFAICEH